MLIYKSDNSVVVEENRQSRVWWVGTWPESIGNVNIDARRYIFHLLVDDA